MDEWLHKFGAIAGILGFILASVVAYGNKEFRCFYGLGLKSDECPNTKLTANGIAASSTISAIENGGTSTKIDSKASKQLALKESTPNVSSEGVRNLQKLLADRGFYNGAVDGVMGERTREAIIAAQKAYNLTADGIPGSRTIGALESDGN